MQYEPRSDLTVDAVSSEAHSGHVWHTRGGGPLGFVGIYSPCVTRETLHWMNRASSTTARCMSSKRRPNRKGNRWCANVGLQVVSAAQFLADRSAQLFGLGEDVLEPLGRDTLNLGGLVDLSAEESQSSQPVS
jgi:hypothetical protein